MAAGEIILFGGDLFLPEVFLPHKRGLGKLKAVHRFDILRFCFCQLPAVERGDDLSLSDLLSQVFADLRDDAGKAWDDMSDLILVEDDLSRKIENRFHLNRASRPDFYS